MDYLQSYLQQPGFAAAQAAWDQRLAEYRQRAEREGKLGLAADDNDSRVCYSHLQGEGKGVALEMPSSQNTTGYTPGALGLDRSSNMGDIGDMRDMGGAAQAVTCLKLECATCII